VGSVDTPGRALGVAVSEDYAYVADYPWGLQVVDVSNPASPAIVGSVDTPGGARGVAVSGSYAYVADYSSGLQIVPAQCEEPVTPSEMLAELASFVTSLGLPHGIERSLLAKIEAAQGAVDRGNARAASRVLHAFVNQVEAQRGQHISDPDADALIQAAEAIIAVLAADGTPPGFDGKYARVAASPNGTLEVFRLSTSAPNPFDRSTKIAFALPRPSPVTLGVYDVAGRLVRDHTVSWNGRDDAGMRVAGGTYFVKLTAGDLSQTRKVVFLGGR
jgi:hypothetical protein